ncbi:MAG: AbrB/MazE/SpoVT family DNA-binding domain-containing protein [Parcubacteria group bacterium]|nr:AbrB/MazE/SpoVT family DNA-binding domain-containing protein [Parcubacteria group bacterium]
MSTKVQKWGNSLAVRFPKEVTKKLNLAEGVEVDIIPRAKNIIIKPKSKLKRKFTLEELLSKITPKNRHKETNWGRPVGREIW